MKVTSYFDGTPSQGSLYVDSYLEVKDKYSYFLGGVQPLCVVETGLTDAPLPAADPGLLLRQSDPLPDSELLPDPPV